MKTKIACCQMQSGLGTVQENIDKMIQKIEEVMASDPVDLIIFPELATTGYECSEMYEELAETFPDGKTIGIFSEQAKKHNVHIIFGFVEKEIATLSGDELNQEDAADKNSDTKASETDNKKSKTNIYNAAAIIDNEGKPLGTYRKSHLVEGEETKFFKKGTEYKVFDTKIGKIGIMICWDTAYPEVARILALKGAEIIAVPAAWETEPNEGDWEIVNMARSFDNVVYLASCNHVGKDRELEYFGRSKISGPLGRPIAEAGAGDEIIKATVDLDKIPELREGYYVLLKDRNPNTYDEITK